MQKTSISDINLSNRQTGAKTFIPKGTALTLSFDPQRQSRIKCTLPDGNSFSVLAQNGKKYFGAPFMAQPSMKTLEKWSDDGVAKTLTGERIEPDGIGSNGAPSWLLALGLM